MNYNKSVDYQTIKAPKMRRSIIDIPFKNDLTVELGKLIPVYQYDVVPGTSIKMKSIAQIRTINPFKVPNFDNLVADFFWFFTPYRCVWSQFPQFLGGSATNRSENVSKFGPISGLTSDWNADAIGSGRLPAIVNNSSEKKLPTSLVLPGSIYDYMGIPVANESDRSESNYYCINNALPFMAYNMVWNENFRDENVMSFKAVGYNWNNMPYNYLSLLPVCKKRDFFTTSLIKPQKGNSISISVGTQAPLVVPTGLEAPVRVHGKLSGEDVDGTVSIYSGNNGTENQVGFGINTPDLKKCYIKSDGSFVIDDGYYALQEPIYLKSDDLNSMGAYADLSRAVGIDVSQLRTMVQCQRYLELLAIGGSRYDEMLEAFYGVNTGDRSLQKPEFLGSASVDLNIQEVVKTASDETLGFTGARSNSVDSAGHWVKSFSEYGIVQCFMCVRQKYNTYQQGLNPLLDVSNRLEFHNPVFNHISYQPTKNKLIFMKPDNISLEQNESVFGYQEPFQRFKSMPNQVHGDLLSNAGDSTLDYWNMADFYSDLPTLTSEWLKSTDVNLKRALLIPAEETAPVRPFVVNFRCKARATLPIPVNSLPGLMDHIGI